MFNIGDRPVQRGKCSHYSPDYLLFQQPQQGGTGPLTTQTWPADLQLLVLENIYT